MLSPHILMMRAGMQSWPFALFMFNFFICLVMSFGEKFTSLSFKSVIKLQGGSMLEVSFKVHCFLKYSLKSWHFSLKAVMKEPSCKIGGITENAFLLSNFFNALQYFFCPVLWSEISDPSRFRYLSFSFKTSSEYSHLRLSIYILSACGHPLFTNLLNFLL